MQAKLIRKGARALGLKLDRNQEKAFLKLLGLLKQWSKRINLTSITKDEDIITKHFLDSLSCVLSGKIKDDADVVDIGSGAGFPGIPIKIVKPDINLVLLDALLKRAQFLIETINILGLEETEAIHIRVEDFAKGNKREAFDIALARAVAPLSVLLEYGLPLLRVGGYLIAQKGKGATKEAESTQTTARILGGSIEEVREVLVPNLRAKRFLVLVRKDKPTSLKFPRRAGIPTKRPLRANKQIKD